MKSLRILAALGVLTCFSCGGQTSPFEELPNDRDNEGTAEAETLIDLTGTA